MTHVLIPLDGSPTSEKALDYAEKLVGTDSKFTLLTVVNLPARQVFTDASNVLSQAVIADVWGVSADHRPEEITDEVSRGILTHAEEYLHQFTERLTTLGIKADISVQIGMRAEAINRSAAALGVDSIFMVTQGPSTLWRRVFGGVAAEVISGAPCPVFVIPSTFQLEELNFESEDLERA